MLNALQGKIPAYLYALQKVAVFRPREATHLLLKIFEKGELKERLAAFRTAVFSQKMGDGKLIGDLFVKLMAATTSDERKEYVEPFFQNLLQRSSPNISKEAKGKLAWLNALLYGWRQES